MWKKKKAFCLLFSSIASFSILKKDATFFYLFKHCSTGLNLSQLGSTRLNAAQLGSTRLNLAQRGSFLHLIIACNFSKWFLFAIIASNFCMSFLLEIFGSAWLSLAQLGSVHYFLLFFPFWLTTTLSHLMAVYSANEIRTFFYVTFSLSNETHLPFYKCAKIGSYTLYPLLFIPKLGMNNRI